MSGLKPLRGLASLEKQDHPKAAPKTKAKLQRRNIFNLNSHLNLRPGRLNMSERRSEKISQAEGIAGPWISNHSQSRLTVGFSAVSSSQNPSGCGNWIYVTWSLVPKRDPQDNLPKVACSQTVKRRAKFLFSRGRWESASVPGLKVSELPKLKSHGFLKAKEGQCAAVRQQDFSHVVVSVSHAVAKNLLESVRSWPKPMDGPSQMGQHWAWKSVSTMAETPKNTTPEHTSTSHVCHGASLAFERDPLGAPLVRVQVMSGRLGRRPQNWPLALTILGFSCTSMVLMLHCGCRVVSDPGDRSVLSFSYLQRLPSATFPAFVSSSYQFSQKKEVVNRTETLNIGDPTACFSLLHQVNHVALVASSPVQKNPMDVPCNFLFVCFWSWL